MFLTVPRIVWRQRAAREMHSVVISGVDRQAPYLEQLINRYAPNVRARYYTANRANLWRAAIRTATADASITFPGPRPNSILQEICELRRRPAIVLWAGTDVLDVVRHPGDTDFVRAQPFVHWTCAPHLSAELATVGIRSQYVPVASALVPARAAAYPKTFTVLSYLPEPRREFYGQRILWEAARKLPLARFLVVGQGTPDPHAPPNVFYAGEVSNIAEYIDASCVLLRFAKHDGLARMVIEALARGRHVLWNYPLPGAALVSESSLLETLKTLYDEHRRGNLLLNTRGMAYVARAHHPAFIANGIAERIRDAIAHLPSSAPADCTARIAISGTDPLAYRVASNYRERSPDIAVSTVTTQSAAARLAAAVEILRSDVWCTVGGQATSPLLELAAFLSFKRHIAYWMSNGVEALRCKARTLEHIAQGERVARDVIALGFDAKHSITAPKRPER